MLDLIKQFGAGGNLMALPRQPYLKLLFESLITPVLLLVRAESQEIEASESMWDYITFDHIERVITMPAGETCTFLSPCDKYRRPSGNHGWEGLIQMFHKDIHCYLTKMTIWP